MLVVMFIGLLVGYDVLVITWLVKRHGGLGDGEGLL